MPHCCDPAYAFALWNLIIRPPRMVYAASQMGPTEFEVNGKRAARRDVRLRTGRGAWLACSHFVPRQDRTKHLRKFPVVIYLHGSSSSRLEAGGVVGNVLAQDMSLFCYDSAGCGHSDGEYVSLGWHERDDLAAVIAHLRQSPFCGPIGLWGRSMGAVTALLHADRDPTLGAICLDSPFASLRQLSEELAQDYNAVFHLPPCLLSLAIAVVRMRVRALADFDIEDVEPLEHVKKTFTPAMFMHGRQDMFIRPAHSRQLYDAYAGDKELVTIDGDHNTERSAQVINHAISFFRRAFRLGEADLSVPTHILPEVERVMPQKVPQQEAQPHRGPPWSPAPVFQAAPGCGSSPLRVAELPRCSSPCRATPGILRARQQAPAPLPAATRPLAPAVTRHSSCPSPPLPGKRLDPCDRTMPRPAIAACGGA